MKLKKISCLLIGLMQAIAVFVYVLLVSLLMKKLEDVNFVAADFWGPLTVLFLLVVSAAICGVILFAYPAYLLIEKQIKRALYVCLWTLLFAVIIFAFVMLFLLIL